MTARFVSVVFPAVSVFALNDVLVAFVMVAFGANSPPKVVRSPVKKPLPLTARVADGDVVPIPKEPPAVKTEESAPAVL